jgi:outer membrane protein assembly factor BamA
MGKHLFYFIFYFLLGSLVFSSCTARRLVPPNHYLITKNEIVIDEKKSSFTKSDLSGFVSHKPRRSFLGIRFKLWTYFITEPYKSRKFLGWIHQKIGTEPLYYDEFTASSNAAQMQRYLANVGYMHAVVTPEVQIEKHKARLIFNVKASWPYTISEIEKTIPDTVLAGFVTSIHNNTLIKSGDILNIYKMSDERDRIATYLKNNGYYFFSSDYIHFDVDTNLLSRKASLKMRIENVKSKTLSETGQPFITTHKRYFINQVNIHPLYNPFINSTIAFDTALVQVYSRDENKMHNQYFIYPGDPRINIKRFDQIIHIKDNEAFSVSNVKDTYRGLTNFRIFGNSNITFDTSIVTHRFQNDGRNWLDCNILLQRNALNGYAVELEGTNSSGDLGIKGNIVFHNKNIFRGSEQFRLRANAGIEAQQISLDTLGSENNVFNTTEFGIDASVFFPRFLSPVYLKNFINDYQPKTNITTGFNSQKRLNYSRFIVNLSFGYDWMASPTVQHVLTLININSVKVNPSAAFQEKLNLEINQRIKDQYSNHLIIGLKYSFIFNNQNINKINDFFYFRANFESSGNGLSLFNKSMPVDTSNNQRQIMGVTYAQFFRFDFDFRYYRLLTENNRLVFRTIIGAGLPYGNSLEMPFERSFYAGGANGMRGWQFRELGPGSYNGSNKVERIGDIQLEASGEYRFPIYSLLKGALFLDVGNIWTINESSYLPGGQFDLGSFQNELAVDAGFGIRLDFSFFIFRIDGAVPFRDPSRDFGDRWMIDKLQLRHSRFNFGIGYPF